MKKETISLEGHLWYVKDLKTPHSLLKAVFSYTNPSELRTDFNELMYYVNSLAICMSRTPAKTLEVYSFLRSIIRVSYKMYCKPKKYHVQLPLTPLDNTNFHLFIGNLLYDEYLNPYLTFKNVFEKQSYKEIEIDLYQIIQYAIGSFSDDPPPKSLSATFITVNKLLDACWLIHKRDYLKDSERLLTTMI
ncbi:hypothetical protein LNQ81_11565 [Myroides sp. M-43]|uniref:hypothetical protein n=1 Tax=Myroides oncorhynchi TaxID=2893756 RepID=UPI001E52DF91|nr:hypothetical protein [Myroides oncorhynchi]MCC9043309.1 hypothetical protein [Myroides oncorhynchi]